MKKLLETALIEASNALEVIFDHIDQCPISAQVDIGAKLRALIKNSEELDERIKSAIKVDLQGKDGVVFGKKFKANLLNVSNTRFDTNAFKAKHPKYYDLFSETSTGPRITYEVR